MRCLISLIVLFVGCSQPLQQGSDAAVDGHAVLAVAEGESLGEVNEWTGQLPLYGPVDERRPNPAPDDQLPDDGPEVFRGESFPKIPDSETSQAAESREPETSLDAPPVPLDAKQDADQPDTAANTAKRQTAISDAESAPGIEWLSTIAEAKQTGKPGLAVFSTSQHCEACRVFERRVLADATVQELARKYACVLIKDDREVAKQYRVEDYPVVLILKDERLWVLDHDDKAKFVRQLRGWLKTYQKGE